MRLDKIQSHDFEIKLHATYRTSAFCASVVAESARGINMRGCLNSWMDGTMRRGHKTQLNGTHLEKREGREDDGNIEVMSCERIGDES